MTKKNSIEKTIKGVSKIAKKTKTINYNNVRISKENKQIISNNIENYIVDSIETDSQYSSYFDLKKKVSQFIVVQANLLMTPENIKILNLFGINGYTPQNNNSCMIKRIRYYDKVNILYNIRTEYINRMGKLDSNIILLNDVKLDIMFDCIIDMFEIIQKNHLTEEIKEDIQMLLKQHYDIFCELQLVCDEFKARIFKFKKGNTLLKKYPEYKKLLVGVSETIVKEVHTNSLVEQFESCN